MVSIWAWHRLASRTLADLDRLAKVIRDCGSEHDADYSPGPLGESELIVQAEGPPELAQSVADDPDVIEVFPTLVTEVAGTEVGA